MGIEKSSLGIVLGVGVGVIALSNNVSAESIDSKMKLEETRIKYTKENTTNKHFVYEFVKRL